MSWGLGDTVVIPQESEPAKWLRDHLRTWLTPKFPSLTGYAVGMQPSGWNPDEDAPYLAVFDDSGPMKWPVETRPTLRVVVWSDSLTLSRDIAGYALGQTLSRKVDGFATVLPGTRVLDARDTNNSGIMASYTVRTRVRTLVPEA